MMNAEAKLGGTPPSSALRAAVAMASRVLANLDTPQSTAREIVGIVQTKGIESFYEESVLRGIKKVDLAQQIAIESKLALFPSTTPVNGVDEQVSEGGTLPSIVDGCERWSLFSNGFLYVVNPWDGDSFMDAYSKHNDIKGTGVIGYPALMEILDKREDSNLAETTAGASTEVVDDESDRWINSIIMRAARLGASDVHLIPGLEQVTIRVRVDGETRQLTTLPFGPGYASERYKAISNRLLSRSKASQQLTYYREAVDGVFLFDELQGRQIKVRVAGLPATLPNQRDPHHKYGLRLLGNSLDSFNLQDLGLPNTEDNPQLQQLTMMSESKHGLILVTGPTGAGKTTTLYALLQSVRSNDSSKMIHTLEDPPEMNMNGVTHAAIDEKLGWSQGLRNILRQDPDVILVGEIRGLEVGKISIEASQTGHLVMSTLHTNSGIGTITRLRDMGLEPYNIADVLLGVTAQRLSKQVCPTCSTEAYWGELTNGQHQHLRGVDKATMRMHYMNIREKYSDLKWQLKADDKVLVPGTGCKQCSGTGYVGRIAISELLSMNPELEELILRGATHSQMHAIARSKYNFLEMWEHAMQLIKAKVITFDHAIGALGPRQAVIEG